MAKLSVAAHSAGGETTGNINTIYLFTVVSVNLVTGQDQKKKTSPLLKRPSRPSRPSTLRQSLRRILDRIGKRQMSIFGQRRKMQREAGRTGMHPNFSVFQSVITTTTKQSSFILTGPRTENTCERAEDHDLCHGDCTALVNRQVRLSRSELII